MTDQVFTLNEDRLAEMAKVFKASDVAKCRFTVEGMVGPVVKSKSMVSLLGRIGVDIVKLGIENVGREFNRRTNKRQCREDILEALELLQGDGIKVVGYLLLDGETTAKEHKETLKFCKDASFDYYKINMLTAPKSDLGTDRYKYDAHFSTARVDEWGMPSSVVSDYLELYASRGKHPHLSHL
jgi:histone acetyltransferase (RNA polymerase elongator complex component)